MTKYEILSSRVGTVGDIVTGDDLTGCNVRAMTKARLIAVVPPKPKKKAVKAEDGDA